MGNVYRSDHSSDGDLLERHLAREVDPHLAHCVRCAERAAAIARALDALDDESAESPFDERFYRGQAARIRDRIAAGDRGRTSIRSLFARRALPRVVWFGGSMAAAVSLAVALHDRVPMPFRAHTGEQAVVAGFASAQDEADDRLLRSIDDTLDEDPYDFAPADG